jgi:hypothetical protein
MEDEFCSAQIVDNHILRNQLSLFTFQFQLSVLNLASLPQFFIKLVHSLQTKLTLIFSVKDLFRKSAQCNGLLFKTIDRLMVVPFY